MTKKTCRDCIHERVCDSLIKNGLPYIDNEFPAEAFCMAFADKSRFIELPCEFMQKCFVIPTIENRLNEITEMKCIGFAISNDSFNSNLITDKNKLYQPCFGAFGKTVFLTREEAEKALKEREQE